MTEKKPVEEKMPNGQQFENIDITDIAAHLITGKMMADKPEFKYFR